MIIEGLLCPKKKCFWSKCLRSVLIGISLAATLVGAGRFCLQQTRGFAFYKICSSLPFNPLWEVPPLSCEENRALEEILNQPYRLLDKGAQAYVFLSEDGRYVIKFFKLHSLRPSPLLEAFRLPLHLQPYRLAKMLMKKEVLSKTFSSYKIAYEELREETGVVFLHLNKTPILQPKKFTLIDNIGITHKIDLSKMEFLVQKRASLFYPFLEKSIEDGEIQTSKKLLSDLVHLLVVRHQKGIFDKDPDLTTNFGCLKDKVIQIDIGRFQKDPLRKDPKVYPSEIRKITNVLNTWLKKRCPLLSEYLEKEIATLESNGKV